MLTCVPVHEIKRLLTSVKPEVERLELLADVFRLNALFMIKRAGSGHVGTSFSCMDILSCLFGSVLREPNLEREAGGVLGDTFFSSKGHDVPAIYSVLIGLGRLPEDGLHSLRRLGGLPGHPDIRTPGIVTNTGSLGMGISKARGMALANRLSGHDGRIVLLTGDGELQEGQFWESLQPTANLGLSEITVIVDHNKIQSDTWVRNASDLGSLDAKLDSFGWAVARCDGHDVPALLETLRGFEAINDRPQILIADTVKGRGVSFMEPKGSEGDGGLYGFHSGAPSDEDYARAVEELRNRIDARLESNGFGNLEVQQVSAQPGAAAPRQPQRLIQAYADELVRLGEEHRDLVVLDADLVLDCGLIPFRDRFPDRFFECGIAEQDMVSMAGGFALFGKLPIAHSFACFLSTRPNEQIYNNATERTKIIYVGSLAGVLPAGPGHSHQSVRDISALSSIPGLTLIEPATEEETRWALRWAVEENEESTYLRLTSIPVDVPFQLPGDAQHVIGRGIALREGNDAVVLGHGPVLLSEAMRAAEELEAEDGLSVGVVDMPWLNRVDGDWLEGLANSARVLFTLDDHYTLHGQGMVIASALAERTPASTTRVIRYGLEEIPECGTNPEVLEHHRLDAKGIASRIRRELREA